MEREVEQHLLPHFLEKGFERVDLSPNENTPELKRAFPLGTLKRRKSADLELVEVQFDKHGGPRFIINVGIIPRGGITLPWGQHLDQDEANATVSPDAYRLSDSSRREKWFQLGFFSRKNEESVARAVDRAIELSGEIDQWFETGTAGKHMRFIGLV